MKLTRIFIYPIKSLGEVELRDAKIGAFGLENDRRWMIVNVDGIAITQRQNPELSQFLVQLEDETIIVTHKKVLDFKVNLPLSLTDGDSISVKIWDDSCMAVKAESNINNQFSKMLGVDVSLVYLPSTNGRIVNTDYAKNGEITSFTDGFPILILGESALNFLNDKLENKISVQRFRPNLVFTGGSPNFEDKFKQFSIGKNIFKAVKPCSRCIITTINPETTEKETEPLKTLNTYRLIDNKVMFGMNVLVVKGSNIRVGDGLHLI